VTAGDDVAAALETAVERADLGDCVLLVGSLFAVAEARAARMRTVTLGPSAGATRTRTQRALDIGGVPTGDESGASRRRREGIDHRVLSLRLRGDRAERLTAALREAGGDAAIGASAPARVASRAASTSPSRLRERWGVPRAARPAPRARG